MKILRYSYSFAAWCKFLVRQSCCERGKRETPPLKIQPKQTLSWMHPLSFKQRRREQRRTGGFKASITRLTQEVCAGCPLWHLRQWNMSVWVILSSYSLYLHIRCTILFLEFRLNGEKLFFMAIPKSHFTCHRRSPPFFKSNNKIRIADPAKWLNFQIIILTVQNYFTPPRDEVDNMGNSDSKASLKQQKSPKNYDGYTGHE